MNVKKEVYDKIIKSLSNELKACKYKIAQNKYEFKKLTEQQTILKRECAELTIMLKGLTDKREAKS